MIIHSRSYPRAALVGNPSDGYNGKTIAFLFSQFEAQVTLWHTPELSILPNERDQSVFSGMSHLVQDVNRFGYYGGIRLLKATIKVFHDYCARSSIRLDGRTFSVRYQSTIPHSLGLAGSSAIITSCMRALMAFYGVHISPAVLANLVLSVETEELKIPAGLQDRVAQAFQVPIYMDFDKALMQRQGYGAYTPIPVSKLPTLYIAYRRALSEGSEIIHSDLRRRFLNGEPAVLAAIEEWKSLTDQVYAHINKGTTNEIAPLLNRNFDLRCEVSMVSKGNKEMVAAARSCGASAKLTGSGGAIIGTYENEAMFEKLVTTMKPMGIDVIKPSIVDMPIE